MKREEFTTVLVAVLAMFCAARPLAGQGLSVSVDQTSVTEATKSIKAIVTRPGDPNESLTVTLHISDDTVLYAPSEVTIRAGDSSAEVDIVVVNDGLIDGQQSAILTADADAYGSASASITVLDDDTGDWATLSGYLFGTITQGGYEVIHDITVDKDRQLVIELAEHQDRLIIVQRGLRFGQ